MILETTTTTSLLDLSDPTVLVIPFFVVSWFVLSIILAAWVFIDATNQDRPELKNNAFFWMLFVIIAGLFGLIIYLIIRNPRRRRRRKY